MKFGIQEKKQQIMSTFLITCFKVIHQSRLGTWPFVFFSILKVCSNLHVIPNSRIYTFRWLKKDQLKVVGLITVKSQSTLVG